MLRFLNANAPACHSIESTRLIETRAMANLPPRTLMQRAGTSLARLARAIAPHARTIWIACGPGNNGGDGMEAAIQLKRHHHNVVVTWVSDMRQPAEAKKALEAAMEAGVNFAIQPPAALQPGDLCIDAILGIGANRAPKGKMNEWLQLMRSAPSDLISVDVPSGLDADSGILLPNLRFSETSILSGIAQSTSAMPDIARSIKHPLQRRHTLTFLSGKPGLLTGEGMDLAGEIWLDDLGADTWIQSVPPEWTVNCSQPTRAITHEAHKGSRGDVVVVGGAGDSEKGRSMAGACTLAGAGALYGGAGRVYLHLLDRTASPSNPVLPELMYRQLDDLNLQAITAVCGCGGGKSVANLVPNLLTDCKQVVLDADALNAIAKDPALRTLLQYRAQMNWQTVLTPHPLEAARLLGTDVASVQADRLDASHALVKAYNCVVVLKGSGTLIAAPDLPCHINCTGNSRLATAGTGDVLAGYIGALMAQGMPAFEAACIATRRHGQVADEWPAHLPLTALGVAQAL